MSTISDADANNFPFNCIGLLVGREVKTKGPSFGTAFLIAPDLILTVAHNILYRKTKNDPPIRFTNFQFFPGNSAFGTEYTNGIPIV